MDTLKIPSIDATTILQSIIESIPTGCKDTFLSTLTHTNPGHLRYHQEPYGWHALCCGLISAHYAEKHGGNAEIGFRLGFLHDIGKPFCESPSGFTFGHGQVGAHIADFLFGDTYADLKTVLLLIIDQHMCVCTHSHGEHTVCYEVLSSMMVDFTPSQKEQFAIYYHALVMGDRLGKICDDNITIDEAALIASSSLSGIMSCRTIPKTSDTTFIVMHGTPGCGKSHASNMLKTLLAKYNLSVGVAERDQIFHMIARRNKLIGNEITFEQYVGEEICVDGIMITRYKQFYPVLRKSIADSYRAVIEDMREKHDIVIIDSCVSLNMQTLATFITPMDTIMVWNGFPQHMFGRNGSLKIDEQTTYPLTQEGAFYRSIIEGAHEKQEFRPLVCSSRVNEMASIIHMMWKTRAVDEIQAIVHPVVFLNSGHTIEDLKRATSYLLADTPKAYESDEFNVIRLGYRDGTQHGNGPILHFRGETIVQDKTGTWHPLRISLPVTPETGQLRRFQSHASVYNYLTGLKPFLKGEFTVPRVIPKTSTYNKCYMLPKVDGSLMTAWCVRKDSVQGRFAHSKKEMAGRFLLEVDDCMLVLAQSHASFLRKQWTISMSLSIVFLVHLSRLRTWRER
jgi:hypothetical protein